MNSNFNVNFKYVIKFLVGIALSYITLLLGGVFWFISLGTFINSLKLHWNLCETVLCYFDITFWQVRTITFASEYLLILIVKIFM